MNFKPNLLKSIVSVASGVLVNCLLTTTEMVECICHMGVPCKCPSPSWLEHAFNPVPLVISIVMIGIVYSVWSFIQKKKKSITH